MNKFIYGLLAGISVLSGFFLFYIEIIFTGLFLILVPSFLVYFFIFRKKYGKIIRYVLMPFLTISIIILTPVLVFVEYIFPISSLWRYSGILNSFGNTQYVQHFPRKIDRSLEDIEFLYRPQFLQGGGQLILKEKLSKNLFLEKYDYFYSLDGNVYLREDTLGKFTAISSIGENPTEYEIIGTFGKPYKENNWNHGKMSGVALNKENNIIIYWYEFW